MITKNLLFIIAIAALGIICMAGIFFDLSSTFVAQEPDYPNQWQKP